MLKKVNKIKHKIFNIKLKPKKLSVYKKYKLTQKFMLNLYDRLMFNLKIKYFQNMIYNHLKIYLKFCVDIQ